MKRRRQNIISIGWLPVAYSILISFLIVYGCSTKPATFKKTPSTAVDTARLTDAIKSSNTHQDAIIQDGKTLSKELPEDERPPRIVDHATKTKTELAKAGQTVADLKAKETEAQKIDEEKDKQIEDITAANVELQGKLDSSSAWIYGLMIVIGAIGIPVSIAVMVKLDGQIGAFGLIIAVGSVVTGYFLREFACWIPLIGAGCAVWGGIMFWRQHSKDQETHKENDEAVRELVATTAEVQKNGWNQQTHDRLSDMISEPTREKVKEARKKHKIARVDLPPIAVTGTL